MHEPVADHVVELQVPSLKAHGSVQCGACTHVFQKRFEAFGVAYATVPAEQDLPATHLGITEIRPVAAK